MKTNILVSLLSIFIVMAVEVHAQPGYVKEPFSSCFDKTNFYAKVFGGANFLQNTSIDRNKANYQAGYIVSGSLGYKGCYGLRLEGEYAFRRNAISKIHFYGEESSKKGHFQASSWMGNLLWDVPLSTFGRTCGDFQPFLGAGIGYDFQQMHSSNSRILFHQKWRHFAWQLMAGLAYPIFCNTEITLEYRFHQGGAHFNNHSVGIGLVYDFGFWP